MITVYECSECDQVEICQGKLHDKDCLGDIRVMAGTELSEYSLKFVTHKRTTMKKFIYRDNEYNKLAVATGLPQLRRLFFWKYLDFSGQNEQRTS